MKTKVTILWLLLIFLVSAPALAGGWLIYHDGPYTGKVVDAETGEPIEGAAVVGIWHLEIYGGAGGVLSKFFDANEAITDKNGEFEVSLATGFYWWPFSKLGRPEIIIYKSSYDSYPPSLPIVTPAYTEDDWKKKNEYQLKYWQKIEKTIYNLVKLVKVKNMEERKWVQSHISLSGIPNEILVKKIVRTTNLINNERKFFDKEQIYRAE